MFRRLYIQVLIAIAAGALLGHLFPQVAVALRPLGDLFVGLVRMLIAPLIFCTVAIGIAGMEDMKRVGRTGGLALLYFELVSSLALVIGLVVGNLARPGMGLHIDPRLLDAGRIAAYTSGTPSHGVAEFLERLMPTSLFDALARGDILQVLVFAGLFGFALQACGGRESRVFRALDELSRVLFAMVALIMRVAPLGAFGAMAFTVGQYGLKPLAALAWLLGCFYAACLLFVFGVLGLIARLHGIRLLGVLGYLREELLVVLGTSSSETVLPRLMTRLEALGVRRPVVNLLIPTGYSLNLDGTAIYLTLAVLFIAQATDTPLPLGSQLLLLAVLLLSSKGAAGVTGSGFIVLAATLQSVGTLPVAGVTLILGIDRFMSEARALTNVVGNAVATLVVARWTGELDLEAAAAAPISGMRPTAPVEFPE
jgi:aerobic C4-dicarboxylate transport protein